MELLLDDARTGDLEAAACALLHLGAGSIPALKAAFRAEADGDLRSFIVHVAWQHRDALAIPLLAEAVSDTHPEVWKQALDGLVTLGAIDALRSLREEFARSGEGGAERLAWIEEAIGQVDPSREGNRR